MKNRPLSQESQNEFRKSEQRFREAFEHAAIGMSINTIDGRFIHANQAYCRMVGYSLEELRQAHFTFQKLVHPDDVERNNQLLGKLLEGEIPAFFLEKRYVCKRGETIWVRASVSLQKDSSGNPLQLTRLVEDITIRKKTEEELRHSQKMEAIGHLAGGVAHEFNNMLTVIIGNADILNIALEPSSPLKRNVEEILKSARRSSEMTNQLLGYARKQIVKPQVVNINQVISNQIPLLGRMIRENIAIQFQPGPNLWSIEIDPLQLEQILSNLAVNAQDAIPASGAVTIDTKNERIGKPSQKSVALPPGDYVVLRFADTGTGMDEKTLKKIFEPYFTTKEVGKGTGLGLATVYGIVKQNNGVVRVDSEPEKGAAFTFYFPRRAAEAEAAEKNEQRQLAKGTGTVLVVEDEKQILDLAKELLESSGYRVLCAETPSQALQIVAENRGLIDIILTDVIMPEFDGRVLRSLIYDIEPGIPTLFMSGYSEPFWEVHPASNEDDAFIQKPFTAEALTTKLHEVLSTEIRTQK